MTLEEAIEWYTEEYNLVVHTPLDSSDIKELLEWLKELKTYRKRLNEEVANAH